MKKLIPMILILTSFSWLVACGTMNSGSVVNADACRKINEKKKGEHHFKLKHVLVDYNYSIDKSNQSITIEGMVSKLPVEGSNKTTAGFKNTDLFELDQYHMEKCYVNIYFLNEDRKVIDYDRATLRDISIITFPMPFKSIHNYRSEYKFIALSYKFVFVKIVTTSRYEKIYRGKLDIEPIK